MIAEERHALILQKLKSDRVVNIKQLAELLSVSGETVRQDLIAFEKDGLAVRVHGGAVAGKMLPPEDQDGFIGFRLRQNLNLQIKRDIALAAAKLVQENQTVALDSGTTSLEIAKVLKENFEHLIIVTNSLVTALELADKKGFTVICTGGVVTPDEYSFISAYSMLILDNLHTDLLFLTTSGVSLEQGVTDQRIEEILVHKKMMDISEKVVVVTDSSKFEKISFSKVCSLDQVDTIVTDKLLPPEVYARFSAAVRRIILA